MLETIREALPRFGVQCDALTGDGLLARPASESVGPLETDLRALEVEVLSNTGVSVKLGGKTLRGEAASEWPALYHGQTRPVSGHTGHVACYPDSSGYCVPGARLLW